MFSSSTLLSLLALSSLSLSVQAHGPGSLLHEGCRPIARDNKHAHSSIRGSKRQVAAVGSGEGQISGPTAGASAAGYSCDPNQCKLPNCHCASTDPPGGLDPKDVPMFITFTADDAIQSYTLETVKGFLGQRRNPNGCAPLMTYFTSLSYTNYSMVTDWYVAGNDIADHTMTHVAQPPVNEVSGNLIALNALSGIPFSEIIGFRAPFLNYTKQNLIDLHTQNFTYDSSSTSAVPVTDPDTDAFWPYTLDNGMANDCGSVDGLCKGEPKLPGLWEIPMYAIFEGEGATGAHLMDPWLDASASDVLGWMKNTFTDHYNGKKQPFGLYSHPIHLATDYPGIPAPTDQINMINEFLDWATTSDNMQNVWLVSNKQLLAWMKNPVPASQLNTLDEFKCQVPQVSENICNGMLPNQQGLLEHCISDTAGDPLNNSPFFTCYGCPTTTPSPDQPNPPQKNNDGTERTRIPSDCSTPFWDPIGAKCLCNSDDCKFSDGTRAIGPNGGNLTSSGGQNLGGTDTAASETDPYSDFGGSKSGASVSSNLSVKLIGSLSALAFAFFTFA